ncbi:hypothetical protein L1987_53289 [Smallanthus sonchifolius]|uniref:Uncharacterized protein n=1 Tax=Smallanthus sonchifolius TaxID=185202 RepID=A0ACB9EVI1_9ASTR|nr:hypothetical protein L1987_53289 [Smallanthus sonchifolius]
MLDRDYSKTKTVFSPRAPLSGEGVHGGGHKLLSDVHSLHDDERVSNMNPGISLEEGVHDSCVQVVGTNPPEVTENPLPPDEQVISDGLGVTMQPHDANLEVNF